jgi:hypothetical protein
MRGGGNDPSFPHILVAVQLRAGGLQRDCLCWLTNSALVHEPECGGEGGVAGSQPMSTAVHGSPNKPWRSNSIFNLWLRDRI